MISPTRSLATALAVPAALTIGLFVASGLRWAILGVDALIALAALVDMVTLLGAARFEASRRCGPVSSIGEPFDVELALTNLGRSPRRIKVRDDVPDTMTAEPNQFTARVPRRGRVELKYRATPLRRGTYRFDRVYALVASRFGLWERSIRLPAESAVTVYPDIRQVGRYTLLARRDKLSALGVRRSRKLGTDNEFERLRDYAEGDEPRLIDWKSTARRRKLTVRAHQANQSQRILFLIDAGRLMGGDVGDGLSPLDHAFNAMLLLAHVALLQGDQVGLMVYSDRIRAYVPPSGGPRRINRLVHAVHDIFPELVEPRHDRAFFELERRCRKRSLVVLMTDVFDEVNARQVVAHLGNLVGKHLPLGVFLRNRDIFRLADATPDDPAPGFYEGAVAGSILSWRENVLATVRRGGALTLDAFPEELTAPLINQYLQIKARHLL